MHHARIQVQAHRVCDYIRRLDFVNCDCRERPALAGGGAGIQANVNPATIPNEGQKYPDLAAQWWQWAYSFPAADVPFLNEGGPVDASAHQSGNVWFLAGANLGPTTRSATVPTGKQLFFPMANFVNDYPCPEPPTFQPNPGESLEQFRYEPGCRFWIS